MGVTAQGRKSTQPGAVDRAAALLARARLPVIGGLQTDIAGAKAALALAEQLGGVLDHAAGDALSRASRIMSEQGACPASFGEVRNRADIVVIVGHGPIERDPGLIGELFPAEPGLPRPGSNARELVVIGADKVKAQVNDAKVKVTTIGLGGMSLPALIAMLGAAVAGRNPAGDATAVAAKLAKLAERLRGAAFPVFVFCAADLDEPVLYAVLDMVRHLCITTRAATLSLAMPGNGDGVNLCSTWTCGLPVRTSFAGAMPVHDAWKYATVRLIESGEANALLWIDALEAEGEKAPRGVPTVVLTSAGDSGAADDIVIEVACAGRDHDAALYLSHLAGIGMVRAKHRCADAPTVAEVLGEIALLLPTREGRLC
jgi:formylmethanofuran dehydrogenase subunit B